MCFADIAHPHWYYTSSLILYIIHTGWAQLLMEYRRAANIFAASKNRKSAFWGFIEIFGLQLEVLWVKTLSVSKVFISSVFRTTYIYRKGMFGLGKKTLHFPIIFLFMKSNGAKFLWVCIIYKAVQGTGFFPKKVWFSRKMAKTGFFCFHCVTKIPY